MIIVIIIFIKGASRLQGGQAIKLIGWDQNEEGNYWIAENSWG
jgi:hypothetical protein